jgi:hypothetical protein
MKERKILRSLLVYLVALIFVVSMVLSCSLSESGSGNLTIYLTDAPVDDFDQVVVNIKDIIGMMEGDEESTEAKNQILILSFESGEKQLNLLSLHGVTENLGTGDIPVGKYTQIRLVVYPTGNYVVPKGTTETFTMAVASGTESGVKIVIPGGITINEAGTGSLTLDWDMRSVSATQINQDGMGGYIMTPVIKVVNQTPGN